MCWLVSVKMNMTYFLIDEKSKERQSKYNESVELSNKNQLDSGVYFEEQKKKGNDFEM